MSRATSLALLATCWLAVGCQSPTSNEAAASNLLNQPMPDQLTTEVVVNLRQPVVFFRAQPALSSVARDYLYLGPVETDNSGARELSLWVGLASTIDRRYIRELAPVGDELVLVVDGAKLRLPLIPWIHDEEHSPFPTPTPLTATLRAPVTQQQLERISGSKEITVELASTTAPALPYAHWQGRWAAWREIEEDTQMGFDVKVRKLSKNERKQ